jgi:V8-like Glu-specific endopeptidase
MRQGTSRLRWAALSAGVFALALGFLPGTSAAAEPNSQPVTPKSERAAESEQFRAEGVTTVGELRTVDSSVSYLPDGRRQVIGHPGATYIKVHFSSLRLAPGEYVTVSSPDGEESYRYYTDPTRQTHPGNSLHTTDSAGQGFWAISVDGDTAVVALHSDRKSRVTAATVDRFWRGYDAQELKANNVSLQSVCATDARRDVVCYQTSHPTEYARSHAVAKLLISGGGSCTTWRVGNTNRMLTNNHCFSTQSQVSGSEMQFNYQCATCGGNNPGAGTKVTGATLYKTSTGGSGALDYTLYSVNNFTAIQGFGTLYLETRAPVNGERIYIPGHGDGSPKRLSIYEDTQGGAVCTVKNAASDSYNMGYTCDTSGGNSGSPVLSSSHKVLALHHLGGCLNEGARMSLIYPQISSLIDNGGTPPPTGPYFENATNVTISDNTTVYSNISVTGVTGNAPTDLQVGVDIKHTYRGDLVLALVAPDGSVYPLEDFVNSDSGDNVLKTYPVNASAEVANGTWRLRVQDIASFDTGYIDKWSLTF